MKSISQAYVILALSIGEHIPGYIDAYFGPPEWLETVRSAGRLPIADLLSSAAELKNAINAESGLSPSRKDYLSGHARAMETSLLTESVTPSQIERWLEPGSE